MRNFLFEFNHAIENCILEDGKIRFIPDFIEPLSALTEEFYKRMGDFDAFCRDESKNKKPSMVLTELIENIHTFVDLLLNYDAFSFPPKSEIKYPWGTCLSMVKTFPIIEDIVSHYFPNLKYEHNKNNECRVFKANRKFHISDIYKVCKKYNLINPDVSMDAFLSFVRCGDFRTLWTVKKSQTAFLIKQFVDKNIFDDNWLQYVISNLGIDKNTLKSSWAENRCGKNFVVDIKVAASML